MAAVEVAQHVQKKTFEDGKLPGGMPFSPWVTTEEQKDWLVRTVKNSRVFARSTVKNKLGMWVENYSANFERVRSGLNMAELHRAGEGIPAVVMGAGPSVNKYRQLEALKKWSGILIVCDRMLIPALEAGLVPTLVLSTDGDDRVAEFYRHPLCKKNAGRVSVGLNAQTVSPATVRSCPFPVYWFLSAWDNPAQPNSITRWLHIMTGYKLVVQSCGNVGALAWQVAHFLGCDPIGLVGLDYGYPVDLPLTKTIYWNAYLNLARGGGLKGKKATRWAKGCYKAHSVPWSGSKVRSSLMWDTYKTYLMPFIEAASVKTVNCSPESFLSGGKITGMDLDTFIETYDPGKGETPSITPDMEEFEEFLTSVITSRIREWPLLVPASPIPDEMMDTSHLYSTEALQAIAGRFGMRGAPTRESLIQEDQKRPGEVEK